MEISCADFLCLEAKEIGQRRIYDFIIILHLASYLMSVQPYLMARMLAQSNLWEITQLYCSTFISNPYEITRLYFLSLKTHDAASTLSRFQITRLYCVSTTMWKHNKVVY